MFFTVPFSGKGQLRGIHRPYIKVILVFETNSNQNYHIYTKSGSTNIQIKKYQETRAYSFHHKLSKGIKNGHLLEINISKKGVGKRYKDYNLNIGYKENMRFVVI
jgi:hypothetical protein